MTLDLTVVIPCHDRQVSLDRTLVHLAAQEGIERFEVIVVDDGSNPPLRLPSEAPLGTRLLRIPGRERSAARNAGAEAATGALLVFMDDDITAPAGHLCAHQRAHDEWTRAIAVGPVLLTRRAADGPFGRFRDALEASRATAPRGPAPAPNWCTAANMSISADRFRMIGGFDDALRSAEDQDLALRNSDAGGVTIFLPEAAVEHRDPLGFREYVTKAEWSSEQVTRFCLKHPEWPENAERLRVNGLLRWRRDGLALGIRKLAKSALGVPAALPLLHHAVGALEPLVAERTLWRLYAFVLGIHLQRGYRKGLSDDGGTRAGER